MKVNKIKIAGFKSILEPLELDFDQLNGLVRVTGNVGAGKTSIGEAILFGLFGSVKGKVNADLVNWKSNECYVEIDIQCADNQIVIKRGMKRSKSGSVSNTVFDCTCNGAPIVFSNKKEAQSILERDYFDTNKLAIELFCIISFNNFKSLLNMKSADKVAFLDDLFGFDIISSYVASAKDLIKSGDNVINKLESDILVCNSVMENLSDIHEPETLDLDALRRAYAEASEMKTALEAQRKADTEELNTSLADVNTKMVSEQSELTEILALGNRVKKDIDTFKSGICPTCGRPVEEHLMEGLLREQSDLRTKYSNKKSVLDGLNTRKTEITNEINTIYKGINEKILEQSNIMDDAKYRGTVNKKLKEEYEKQLRERDVKMKEMSEKRADAEVKLKENRHDNDIYSEILLILNTKIKSKILQSFVPAINKNVLKYTSSLGLPFAVEFNDVFDVKIVSTVVGKEVNVAALSTGQTKAIDTCIIIGILDALLNKINFNITFFDELLSNMHEDLRDDICKILRENTKKGTTLFLINHSPLKDEYFDHSVEVVNKNGSKYIVK